jgi:hypothetical protein
MSPAAKQVVALAQFVAERDGQTVVVLEGARYPATHAIVKANPTRFAAAPRRAKASK